MGEHPLQNRVTATGEIVSAPARGLVLGNRGCLHEGRRLGRSRWRSAAWISCRLDFGSVQRDVMPPGGWTALFFLDEVTALAAGHRPCGYCRRDDLGWFARSLPAGGPVRAPSIDRQLHAERVDPRTRRQRTRPALAGELPDGAMVRLRAAGGAPDAGSGPQQPGQPEPGHEGIGMLESGTLRLWSLRGYAPARPIAAGTVVELLTPALAVAALAGGYRPLVHPSAGSTALRGLPADPAARGAPATR